MVRVGKIVGFRNYSFIPDGQQKRIEGCRIALEYPLGKDELAQGAGEWAFTASISLRDLDGYIPAVGDNVRFATFVDRGKVKLAFVVPV